MRSLNVTAMKAVRALLLGWALFTILSCQGGPFVRITLDGRGSDITRIKFTGSINGQTELRSFDKTTDLSNITVSLPAGTQGNLTITIEGYFNSISDCVVSRGANSLNIADDTIYQLTISLAEVGTCGRGTYTLTVENDPPSAGVVTVMPLALSCSDSCSPLFPEGANITLTAKPILGYRFKGWSSAVGCGSNPVCNLNLGENLTVRAQYTPCTGWCSESPSSSTSTLYSVHGNAANDIVAVGDAGTILAWNGNSWSAELSGTLMPLHAVGSLGGGYFAAGGNGTVLAPMPTKKWSSIMTSIDKQLNGILETKPNVVFLVGNGGALYKGNINLKLNPICSVIVGQPTYNAIASLPKLNEQFVVGDDGLFVHITNPLPLEFATCTPLLPGTTNDLNSLWVSSKSVYLVGEKGTIIKCVSNGTSCLPLASGTSVSLHGIWGSADDGYLYAVGDDGVILKSTTAGRTWELEQTGVRNNLYSVWGADAKTVYVVGQDGIILRLR